MQVYKQTGKKPPQLAEQPDMPESLAYLWAWFIELRPEFGHLELEAWARMKGRTLSRWEMETLMNLDRMRCARD